MSKINILEEKNRILDSWILLEQVGEGDLKTGYVNPFYRNEGQSAEEILKSAIANYIKKEGKRSKLGVVIYLDKFKFKEVAKTLREASGLKDPIVDETLDNYKFSYAIYFDKDLNYLSDKFFYTVSDLIRKNKTIVTNFDDIERKKSQYFKSVFENEDESFDNKLIRVLGKENISLHNYFYKVISNVDKDDLNLHSFFIKDLEMAKTLDNENLNTYLFGNEESKTVNLDSNKNSENFNPKVLERILQPKYFPMGRFPSNPDYALSLMQQAAVNIAINEPETVRSVNGPPGTGKTTLLKDIFAELLVRQAWDIVNSENVDLLDEGVNYFKKGYINPLKPRVSENNIVVTSSNNGAVQNIVRELPQCKEVYKDFLKESETNSGENQVFTNNIYLDYFSDVANELFKEENKDNSSEEQYWGTFSTEGGKKTNMDNLITRVKGIYDYLDKKYEDKSQIYTEFKKMYENLYEYRDSIQHFSEVHREVVKYKALAEGKDTQGLINIFPINSLQKLYFKYKHNGLKKEYLELKEKYGEIQYLDIEEDYESFQK